MGPKLTYAKQDAPTVADMVRIIMTINNRAGLYVWKDKQLYQREDHGEN